MPLFVTLEGPDGSGKSTQTRRLAARLRSEGYRVTDTREPGGTPLGDRLRTLFLDPAAPAGTTLSMALIVAASRAQLVHEVIRPALARGEIVILDRYADSTIAYQGFGEGLDLEVARALTDIATGGLTPDLTIYLDVPPEMGLRRARARGRENRLDAETLEFHERVRDGYRRLMAESPQRWTRIDGTQPADEVELAIWGAITPMLERVADPPVTQRAAHL